jgi:hypothetical protein
MPLSRFELSKKKIKLVISYDHKDDVPDGDDGTGGGRGRGEACMVDTDVMAYSKIGCHARPS